MTYKNPPLIYVKAECRFGDGVHVQPPVESDTQFANISSAFRASFPDWLPLGKTEDGKLKITETLEGVINSFYANPDTTIFTELGRDSYSVEFYKPYIGWEKASAILATLNDLYFREISPTKVDGAVLRYRNRLVAPDRKQLSEYLAVSPTVTSDSLWHFDSFFTGLKFDRNKSRDSLRIECRKANPQPDTEYAVLVDIIYELESDARINATELMSWYNEAHEQAGFAFENTFQDKSKELFSK